MSTAPWLPASERLIDKASNLIDSVSDPSAREALDHLCAAVMALQNEVRGRDTAARRG